MRILGLIPIVLASSAASLPLLADTVTLTNGDRLTGTVKQVEDGRLVLESKYVGTVRVRWRDIRSVESDAEFSVLTAAGKRFDGRILRAEDRLEVRRDGSPDESLPAESVARVVRGQRRGGIGGLVAGFEGAADLGYSIARGNQNQMQSSLGASADYTSAQYKFQSRLDSLFARQDGAQSQSRHALNARIERFVNARVFAYGLSGFERNERRLLDLRSRLGGGVGWRLRDGRKNRFAALAGFAYIYEHFRNLDNQVAGEAFAGFEWTAEVFKSVELDMQLTVHHNQVDRGRARVEYDSTLRIPIAGPFNYSLRLFDRYDTRPAESVARNDYGLVSGLGIEF